MDIHWTARVHGEAFSIGGKSVAWYGIFITFAMVLALLVCMRRMKKRTGTTSDEMLTLFLIAIPCAIVAARLGYVVANYKEYFVSPYNWQAFVHTIAIWEGGLTILWGVPGGVLGGLLWCKIYHKNFLQCADIILPVALLAQALGRWGNFMNQELYGQLVTNPQHQWFPLAVQIAADNYQWHQATFFYEMVLNLLGYVILSLLYKRVNVRGFGILGYFGYYTLVRAIMEYFRVEINSFDGKVNSTQLICYIAFALCSAMLIFLICWKKFKKHERVFYLHGYPLEFAEEPDDLPEDDLSPKEDTL